MNRTLAASALTVTAALALTGCRSNGYSGQDDYRAVCTDRITGNYLPFDNSCSGGNWYYMPQRTYHDQIEVHHYYHPTGGTSTAPRAVGNRTAKVQYGTSKKVDVFKPSKQAGSSIKLNQDARKSTTVRERPATTGRIGTRSSFGSSSKSSTNRSSFGSTSKPRR